jgi:hypothetical protein
MQASACVAAELAQHWATDLPVPGAARFAGVVEGFLAAVPNANTARSYGIALRA